MFHGLDYVADEFIDNVVRFDRFASLASPRNFTTGVDPVAVAVDPVADASHLLGRFVYVGTGGGHSISRFDTMSGGLISRGTTAIPGALPLPLATQVDPSGKWLLVADYVSNAVHTYSVDGAGALGLVSTTTSPLGPVAIAVTPDVY